MDEAFAKFMGEESASVPALLKENGLITPLVLY